MQDAVFGIFERRVLGLFLSVGCTFRLSGTFGVSGSGSCLGFRVPGLGVGVHG